MMLSSPDVTGFRKKTVFPLNIEVKLIKLFRNHKKYIESSTLLPEIDHE